MPESKKLWLSSPDKIRILAFGDSLTEGYTDWITRHPYGNALKTELSNILPEHSVSVDINGKSGDRVCSSLSGEFFERLESSIPISSASEPFLDDVLESSARPVTPQPPTYDLVIILGGTNDLAFKSRDPDGPAHIFKALEECYNHVLGSGSSLLCLTVPERNIDTQVSALAKIAKSARVTLNDLIIEFAENHRSDDEKGQSSVFLLDLAREVPFTCDDLDSDEQDDVRLWSTDGLHMTAEGYDHVGEKLAVFIHDLVVSERRSSSME
jgi:lysophospholipase L1-like esterase